ncbi:hypothetical protein SAMN00768000_3798 [Sulfobacillus thermosulfidooxidans DSM 9293]|uniref:Uncharacterized protein n=2 Tax=Sulfobacillus thermosulfidooxidans TaxID=28034 RepID=A0A1W1WPL9_SULTA|nr:hypothetical protein [Sulfobacillus thermosulfidooxidans]PSR22182.1 MAG: hypothetical protein C7B47_16830 [Sulfobacillus thermosulfidooxidans]SMC08251.1 hypothetical protein SAMN00768000_3798 [Sulfobacillus thermosulfidooxidans DSM 9293]
MHFPQLAVSQHLQAWPQPPSPAIGWGLTHRLSRRLWSATHIDWIPVLWSERRAWQYWGQWEYTALFLDRRLDRIWTQFPELHVMGGPGHERVLHEAWAIEYVLGCGF